MSVTAFNMGAGGSSKLYLGSAIWSINSVYELDKSVNLTIPTGAIGLYCTASTNTYGTGFRSLTVGTSLISESNGGESRGGLSFTLLLTEALKSDSSVTFYYGSGSGCNYVAYPIMVK